MNSEPQPDTPWTRLRAVANWINLSTPLGLIIARAGGAVIVRRGRGSYLAGGYRWGFPAAGAFTVGSVITSPHELGWLRDRPLLLLHEDRHCTQYGFCLGVAMLPLYVLCAGVSWIIAGDHSSYNPFERLANLADGGYRPPRSRLSRHR
jgi:hypothetical protein